MTARRDGAQAAVAILACAGALDRLDAALSPPAALLGGVGTVLFEAVAARHYDRVRRCWERPAAQATALVGVVAVAVAGVRRGTVAPLSAAVGALATYLCLVVLVTAGVFAPPRRWWPSEDER
jgi:peptidoglycan/LPS O-acetylase OafA/YrhL